MDFWLDLLFGNAVGLSSMIVIFGALGLMLFFGGFFIYKHCQPLLLTRAISPSHVLAPGSNLSVLILDLFFLFR